MCNSPEAVGDGKTCFLVPENCFSSLRRLRRRRRHGTADDNPIFWIDSICIDQKCIPERNHQLSLMCSIYSSASRVMVDLGSESDGSAAFMDWISDLHAPSDYAAPVVQPSRETIQKLFARPWFRRVWVLQEALLAREIAVICGDREVSWEAFKTFKDYDQAKIVRPLPYVLKDSASKWIRDSTEMDEDRISRTLFNFLRESRGCEATDPRDQVYALLPLIMGAFLSPGNYNPLIEPDYSRTMAQVYADLACKFLNTPGIGLGLLRAVFPSSNMSDLPSWVPDWSMKPCFSYMLCDHGSATDHTFLAVSLDDEMDLANPLYTRGRQIWHVDPAVGGLFVSIASLGYITHLTSPAIISSNELPLGQWKTVLPRWCLIRSDDISQPRRLIVQPSLEGYALDQMLNRCELPPFTRILVKDRIVYPDCIQKAEGRITSFEHEHPRRRSRMDVTPSGTNVDGKAVTYPTQLQTYWEEVHSRGRDNHKVRGSLAGLFSMSMGSDHVSAIRILDSCDGRRMAVIGGEWLALVPIEARESDWIGFIRGIRTPMVMRYLEDNSEHQGYRKARLVGECFVLDVAGKGAVAGAAANCLKKIMII